MLCWFTFRCFSTTFPKPAFSRPVFGGNIGEEGAKLLGPWPYSLGPWTSNTRCLWIVTRCMLNEWLLFRFRKLFFVAAVGIFSCLSVGDSARSLRSRRNGVHCRAREGGKRRAAEEKVPCPRTYPRRPSFSPFDPICDAPFRQWR